MPTETPGCKKPEPGAVAVQGCISIPIRSPSRAVQAPKVNLVKIGGSLPDQTRDMRSARSCQLRVASMDVAVRRPQFALLTHIPPPKKTTLCESGALLIESCVHRCALFCCDIP